MFILDGGTFRKKFCQRGWYMGYDWILSDGSGKEIKQPIKPLRPDNYLGVLNGCNPFRGASE